MKTKNEKSAKNARKFNYQKVALFATEQASDLSIEKNVPTFADAWANLDNTAREFWTKFKSIKAREFANFDAYKQSGEYNATHTKTCKIKFVDSGLIVVKFPMIDFIANSVDAFGVSRPVVDKKTPIYFPQIDTTRKCGSITHFIKRAESALKDAKKKGVL